MVGDGDGMGWFEGDVGGFGGLVRGFGGGCWDGQNQDLRDFRIYRMVGLR